MTPKPNTELPSQEIGGFDPLAGNTPSPEYTQIHVNGDIPQSLPEMMITAPLEDFDLDNPNADEGETPAQSSSGPTDNETFNKTFSELPKKDQQNGAEMAADTAIGVYSTLCEKAFARIPKLSESKIQQKITSGKLDKNHVFEVDSEGTQQNIMQFATTFNQNIDMIFAVDEEFVKTIRPPLIRIAQKRGIAVTDEQFVAYKIVEDLSMKAIMAGQLRIGTNMIIKNLEAQAKGKITPMNDIIVQPPSPVDTDQKHEEPISMNFEMDSASVKESYKPNFSNDSISKNGNPGDLDENTLATMESIAKSGNLAPRKYKPRKAKPAAQKTDLTD